MTKDLDQFYEVNYKGINKKIYEDLDGRSCLPWTSAAESEQYRYMLDVFTELLVEDGTDRNQNTQIKDTDKNGNHLILEHDKKLGAINFGGFETGREDFYRRF